MKLFVTVFLFFISLQIQAKETSGEKRTKVVSKKTMEATSDIAPIAVSTKNKKIRFGGFLEIGLEIADTDDSELGNYTGSRFALGPVGYMKLNDRWALRSRLGFKAISLTSDFGVVLFSSKEFEIENNYISLSFGGQFHFTEGIAMSLDYSANFDAGGFSCKDISFNPNSSEEKLFCDTLEKDLNSIVHFLKLGLSFRTAQWLFLEPFIEVSINDLGDSYFNKTTSTGLNISFAF